MRYEDPPTYPLLQTTCPLVILAWAWSYWFQKKGSGGGCGAGGGSVGRKGGLSMLLRWFSCDCWRAGTCLESVIGSGSCQSETRAELLSSSYRISTGEGSNRSELIYSRYQPPLRPLIAFFSPSLRPYYISDVPPFFQPQLSSQPPPVVSSSVCLSPHPNNLLLHRCSIIPPPYQSILTYPPK